MCDYPNNKRYLSLIKTSVICSFLLLISCNFFEAKQQVFECKKTHIGHEKSVNKTLLFNYLT